MTEEQTYIKNMNESLGIALKIGELVCDKQFGVSLMALTSSIKAILLCIPPEDRAGVIANMAMFLSADIDEDDDTEHSVH